MSHDSVHLHSSVHAAIHHASIFIVGLLDDAERLPGHAGPSLLEPHVLDVWDLFIEALILEPVSIHLSLVVLKLGDHVLQLLSTVLQVLLVNLQLLGYLWARLLSQDVFKLNVKLLLLLNKHILLWYLLSFSDQTLLQRLYFLNELISFGVCALEFAPTVHI